MLGQKTFTLGDESKRRFDVQEGRGFPKTERKGVRERKSEEKTAWDHCMCENLTRDGCQTEREEPPSSGSRFHHRGKRVDRRCQTEVITEVGMKVKRDFTKLS